MNGTEFREHEYQQKNGYFSSSEGSSDPLGRITSCRHQVTRRTCLTGESPAAFNTVRSGEEANTKAGTSGLVHAGRGASVQRKGHIANGSVAHSLQGTSRDVCVLDCKNVSQNQADFNESCPVC